MTMAPRGSRMPSGRAKARPRSKLPLGPSARDYVVVSRALADLAEFLRLRQESAGRGQVILDRRVAERRGSAVTVEPERRRSDRRQPPSDGVEALMRVLGFTVIPRVAPTAEPARRRTMKRPVRPSDSPGRIRPGALDPRARRRRP
jgi:hypothetical protein